MNKRFQRQGILFALITFDYADLPSGTFVPMVELPPGAVLVPGVSCLDVKEASDTGTTDVLDVGTSGTPAAYANDANFKAAARTALTGLPVGTLDAKQTIGITRTAVGTAATVGEGSLLVGYVQNGVHCSNYGTLDSGPITS